MSKHTARVERERLVGEWRASGLSQGAFAASRGLVLSSFRRWLRESRLDASEAAPAPVRGFVEVRPRAVRAEGVVARLELGGGVQLALVDWPAPEYLARLCNALGPC